MNAMSELGKNNLKDITILDVQNLNNLISQVFFYKPRTLAEQSYSCTGGPVKIDIFPVTMGGL